MKTGKRKAIMQEIKQEIKIAGIDNDLSIKNMRVDKNKHFNIVVNGDIFKPLLNQNLIPLYC